MHNREDVYRNRVFRVSSLVVIASGTVAYAGYMSHDPQFLMLALAFDLAALAFIGKEFKKIIKKVFF